VGISKTTPNKKINGEKEIKLKFPEKLNPNPMPIKREGMLNKSQCFKPKVLIVLFYSKKTKKEIKPKREILYQSLMLIIDDRSKLTSIIRDQILFLNLGHPFFLLK